MILGIDEVGRGCWAGPLVVTGVCLNKPVDGLKDSKKLSHNQRLKLLSLIDMPYNIIITSWVEVSKVDELGLTKSMEFACQQIFSQTSKFSIDTIIIDGNINYLKDNTKAVAVIGADDKIVSVMAASIVAKETRDQYMRELDKHFPEFNFSNNVGYGTARHREALSKYGVTKHHRHSFKPIQKYVSEAGLYSRNGG